MLSKEWQDYFISIAEIVSQKSKDGSSKFGAVLVRPDKSIASTGFNGFPRGIPDNKMFLEGKTDALRQAKYARIVHAEANCLTYNRDTDLTGYSIFVSGMPCSACALRIISEGVSNVYYSTPTKDYLARWGKSVMISKQLFDEAGVKFIEVQPKREHLDL